MDTFKIVILIIIYINNIYCCTYNNHIYSCNGSTQKSIPYVDSIIKNKTIMIDIHCTRIKNISIIFTEMWSNLKIVSLIQNKYIDCNNLMINKSTEEMLTIYCYNNISSFCESNLKNNAAVNYSYSYLYAILIFVVLPTLISTCTCCSINIYDEINKKGIKKNEINKSTDSWGTRFKKHSIIWQALKQTNKQTNIHIV